MDWRLKAILQRTLAHIPVRIGQPLYRGLQRTFGGLRSANPTFHLKKSCWFVETAERLGRRIQGQTLLEVGTGWTLNVPIGLWLCGAGPITSVDVHRYLDERLVLQSLDHIRHHAGAIRSVFGQRAHTNEFEQRWTRLLNASVSDLESLMRLLNLTYLAPASAARLPLGPASVDLHYSTNVLEHVPPDQMEAIFVEARRILKPDGLTMHRIDLSDHFSHRDGAISPINFLQFDEPTWARWSGNRFMYQNRMRTHEYAQLFERVGLQVRDWNTVTDPRARTALQDGFPLSERFSGHDHEDLAVTFLEVVGQFK